MRTRDSAEARTDWLADTAAGLRARDQQSAVIGHLGIAGHVVRTRYSGPALTDALGRATRHLTSAPSGTPDLTIDCWTESDPARRVPNTWPATGTTYAGDGALVAIWESPDGPLVVYDRDRRHAWALFASVDAVPVWEQATPLRRILHWWAADHGLQMVHAAAVGDSSGGVLLVGRSGSGKSTTALACLQAGLGFAGDDYCLLRPGEPPWVHGLYLSGKGDDRSAGLLPHFSETFSRSTLVADGKAVLWADEVRPESICAGLPLRGIVVPRLSAEPLSRLSPLGPAAAFRALAPSTVLQMPGDRARSLTRLATITQSLPAWELVLGPDPAAAAAVIRDLVHGRWAP